jgi:hypothetical protein
MYSEVPKVFWLPADINTDKSQSEYQSDDELSIFSDVSASSSLSSVVRSNSSVFSSVSNYRYEHDRRYHSYRDGKWVLPNDQVRLTNIFRGWHPKLAFFGICESIWG